MTSRALAAADREPAELDQNRVALLADTHISADPNRVYPGRSGLARPSTRASTKASDDGDGLAFA